MARGITKAKDGSRLLRCAKTGHEHKRGYELERGLYYLDPILAFMDAVEKGKSKVWGLDRVKKMIEKIVVDLKMSTPEIESFISEHVSGLSYADLICADYRKEASIEACLEDVEDLEIDEEDSSSCLPCKERTYYVYECEVQGDGELKVVPKKIPIAHEQKTSEVVNKVIEELENQAESSGSAKHFTILSSSKIAQFSPAEEKKAKRVAPKAKKAPRYSSESSVLPKELAEMHKRAKEERSAKIAAKRAEKKVASA
jgi:hypothetical protein